jgi:hypothetical protein
LRHCSSVKYTTRSLTGLTSGESNIHIISEKQAFKSLAKSRGYKRSKVLQPPLQLVAKPHKRFMTIMIQAIWMKASYMQTWCSYRTTMRRKFPNQLKVLSTVYRLLYRSQSRSSCRL